MSAEEVVNADVRKYVLAGWISILQAVIILPKAGLDIFGKFMTMTGSNIVGLFTGFHVVSQLLGIYVLFMFRRLLNERHSFRKANIFIDILILCYAVAAVVGAVGLALGAQVDVLGILWLISALSSLISIIYAGVMLKLEANLSGLLKPYVYATIASGLFGVTIVLGEYGRPFFMVSCILLGMILIRADSEPEYL